MKLNIKCPHCGSSDISITSEEAGTGRPTPMYQCGKCGYKARLFPKFETDRDFHEGQGQDKEGQEKEEGQETVAEELEDAGDEMDFTEEF